MSISRRWKLWTPNPNAPSITYLLHFSEKAYFAGTIISSMLYGARRPLHPHVRLSLLTPSARSILGVVILLFFQCMDTLFNPVHRRGERIRWGLVSYTVVMFSVTTVGVVMDLNLQSVSYINNREFPGVDVEGVLKFPPGPVGYQLSTSKEVLSIIPNTMFTLTNWLADGLLVSPSMDAAFAHPGA